MLRQRSGKDGHILMRMIKIKSEFKPTEIPKLQFNSKEREIPRKRQGEGSRRKGGKKFECHAVHLVFAG